MIKELSKENAPQTARLHHQGMPNDFLPSFGEEFLTKLHGYLLEDTDVVALGYFSKTELIGTIIGSRNTEKTMHNIMIAGWLKFLPHILYQVIASPKTLTNLWQTLTYAKDHLLLPKAELLVVAVSGNHRHTGVGSQLMNEFKKKFRERKIKEFKVGTLVSNYPANSFYIKMGGKFNSTFSIYGRVWNVYVYDL